MFIAVSTVVDEVIVDCPQQVNKLLRKFNPQQEVIEAGPQVTVDLFSQFIQQQDTHARTTP
jgi:predicted GTPase